MFINILIVMGKNIQYEIVAEFLSTFSNFLIFTLSLTLTVFHASGRLSH
jgi:succinate dehydrogenase hydrophobic anchor subunit